jgi:LmbE family N-acetylglucosaminyl deacetylase
MIKPLSAPAATAALLLAAALPAAAAEPLMHAGHLAHELDRLGSTGRVLYVAAHPDDENTRLMAYLANGRHLAAAYLAMTRGGGGQNLIGAEQGDLLDVIRTEELLAARRIDGAQQRFTRMRDFGYSKTAAETLALWDHDEALADVVWVIRTFQPDVIVTRFDENPPNHGHHTASAILAREAFAAAADPQRFPGQLKDGVKPWQAERLFRNQGLWRGDPPPEGALRLNVGAYDPRLGLGYGELAALSRSQHRSQGFGVPGQRGEILEYFVPLAGSKPPGDDILGGLDLTWNRFGPAAAPLIAALDRARATLERDAPERAIPALLDAHRALDALPAADVRVRDARAALEHLVASAAGLFLRATAPTPTAAPGSEVKLELEVALGRPAAVVLQRIEFPYAPPLEPGAALAAGERRTFPQAVRLPADAPVSVPYWLAAPGTRGRQAVTDPRLIGEPLGPPPLAVTARFRLGERELSIAVPVEHAAVDPVLGERLRPFVIVPPATVTPAREATMVVNGRPATVAVRVRAGRDALEAEVSLPLPAGWKAEPAAQPVKLAKAGDEATVAFTVTAPAGAAPIEAAPVLAADGRRWSLAESTIDYPHVPVQLVLQPATLRLAPLSVQLPPGAIGYIPGSGDSVAEDLASIGATVAVLDEETVRDGDLSRYAAIVVGIRAYNTRPWLRAAHPRLMAFVEQGGTLVAQYSTNNRLAPMESQIGPYPFEISRDRVTDETAAVALLAPGDPALRAPNALGEADFAGWVQERGIYFAAKWDERYTPLFAIADPGEEPLKGSTIVARLGKGRFVYTGLAFFRQLPAGVPGAYRLFANLLARD